DEHESLSLARCAVERGLRPAEGLLQHPSTTVRLPGCDRIGRTCAPRSSPPGGRNSMKIATHRVLIADDHAMFREGLRAVLERQSDLRVVGEAADGLEACERVRLLRPCVILIEHQMPH